MKKIKLMLLDKLKTIFWTGSLAVIFNKIIGLLYWRRRLKEERGLDYLFPNRHDDDFDPDDMNPESFAKE